MIAALAPTEGVEPLRVTTEEEYFPPPPRLRGFIAALQAAVEGGYACRTPGRPGPIDEDRAWDATRALDLLDGVAAVRPG
jgi:hypothetical protein